MADYNRLASMFAAHGEIALFRRFDTLNMKSLLYMQAELVHLEAELHQIENDDKSSPNPEKLKHPFSVYDLKHLASTMQSSQWEKYKEIQEKIQNYSMHATKEGRLTNIWSKYLQTVLYFNTIPCARSLGQP